MNSTKTDSTYIVFYSLLDISRNLPLFIKLQEKTKFKIPYLEFPSLTDEQKSILDNYLYLHPSLVQESFQYLSQNYPNLHLTQLGTITEEALSKMVQSCEKEITQRITIGGFYKVISGKYKNLIVECVETSEDTTNRTAICKFPLLALS